MTRKDFIRLMLVATAAGWIGAMLPGAMLRSDPVIAEEAPAATAVTAQDRKSTRLNSSH